MNELSDSQRVKIEAEANEILDKFGAVLEKVKIPQAKKLSIITSSGFRVQGEGAARDSSFREAMFANAPDKNDECIIAEKKEWS